MMDRAEHFEGVIVLAMNKDGTQFMATSPLTMESKCFLKCFLDSWILRWFSESYEVDR